MNCTKNTRQISNNYWIYINNLFPEKNMRVACAVHMPKNWKLHKNYPFRVLVLPNETNHSLHVPVIYKSHETGIGN